MTGQNECCTALNRMFYRRERSSNSAIIGDLPIRKGDIEIDPHESLSILDRQFIDQCHSMT
jgi:hypothetical protein